MTTTTETDRIEKQVVLRAPRSRVWKALTDAKEFGEWFGVELLGPLAPGALVRGKITHKGYEHVPFELAVERMEAETLFSWRWHPYAHEPGRDYSGEPTTLVVFELHPHAEGTLLKVVESGFDRIPADRRAEAFRMNEHGWTQQVQSIERHVGKTA
jgi:uncharacterized protein YndB with AHSA1/START domain